MRYAICILLFSAELIPEVGRKAYNAENKIKRKWISKLKTKNILQ